MDGPSRRQPAFALVALVAVVAVGAGCSSTTPESATRSTVAGSAPTTVAPVRTNAPSTTSTVVTTTTTTRPTTTTTARASTTTTASPTTTEQRGPVVDPSMSCSVFVTLQPVDRDRIVAKIAFDTKRTPVPDGAAITTACRSHPTEGVATAVACYDVWATGTKFCALGTPVPG